MTLENFAQLLDATGLPVAFYQFPEDEPHEPPFICYITTTPTQFAADGCVYYSGTNIQVELYTMKKDLEAERKIEDALKDFFYVKDEGNLDDEKMYMVTYRLTI